MIGKMLAHYEIRASLGRGGMGEVYLARDTRLGRDVALKLLPVEMRADAGRRARFEREAQAVAALNHPHVVTLHAVEEADGQPFLVMEYVEGRTLDEVIPPDGLPVRRFFELGLALTEAVAAAHAKGITHRDLKPRNVMIDSAGRLKVLDFGLAKLLDRPDAGADEETVAADAGATREGTIVGTVAYMSPEQAEGKPVDSRSDVFSLGILLYQMATGQQPFKGDSQLSILAAVLRDQPPPLVEVRPELPRQLARIVRRCLEKDPARRYETARSAHYDLLSLREELDSGEFEKPELPNPPARRPGRRRIVQLSAGLLLLAVIAFGAVRLGSRGQPEAASAGGAAPADAAAVPTIVVFPFENLGPPEDAYFAAGMTVEIVTSLAAIEGLRVVSRTSSQNYDRTGKSMQRIAEDLGVDYVLEGSVRWQRDAAGASRVRVTPLLTDAAADRQVWASRYDRAMEEIFALQSEIAAEVVRNLGVTLAAAGTVAAAAEPTRDMAAYHAYLRGQEILESSRFRREDWLLAVDLLEKAVARDPQFHEAWVALARANSGLCHFDWDRTPERLARAKAAADRARAIAPDSHLSHYAAGIYYYWGLKDYDRALAAVRQADRIRPDDPDVMELMAYVLRRQESYAEAAVILERVAGLSPGVAPIANHLAETLAIVKRYEDADRWGREAMEFGPDEPMNFTIAAWSAVQAGWPDRARRYVAEIPPFTDPEMRQRLFRIHLEIGDFPAALRHAELLPECMESQYEIISRDLGLAMVYRVMDQPEQARRHFELAERVLSVREAEMPEAGNVVAAHAVALAGAGRADEAAAGIRRSFDLYPVNKDPWIATWRLYDQAVIEMMSGSSAAAVATLSGLMDRQTDVISPAILASSPVFAQLRGRGDYQALLAAHD
ncbi:MAG: protein kinase [Candidatus Latescibacteria bacterium]|nr:protein kinase [Candidatus Latescibacterota bacterium]